MQQRLEKGSGSPGMGVRDGCELPCRCWELNWGPLQKVRLTAEPFLQFKI